MKKLLAIVLVVLLSLSFVCVVEAAEFKDKSIGTAGKVYFEKPSQWAGTIFYTHIFEATGEQTSFFGWQSKKEKLTEEGGKLVYDLSILDDPSAQVSGGLKAGTDYTIIFSDNVGNESCPIMFNTNCIGDTAKIVSSSATFENAVDSTKHSYELGWTANAQKYGVPLMITSVGTVQGQFMAKGQTTADLVKQWDKDYPDYPNASSYSPQSKSRDHKERKAELQTQLSKLVADGKVYLVGGGKFTNVKTTISLSYFQKTVYLNKNFKIKATTSSKCSVFWKTSNKNIASVSKTSSNSGSCITVKGKKVGTAYITATANDGSKKYKKCKVIVRKQVKAKKLTLSKKKVTIYAGKSFTVKATLSPSNVSNKNIKWTSNDPIVAKPVKAISKSGTIMKFKSRGFGTAKVKAMAMDGSKKTSILNVTVKRPKIATSISLSAYYMNIYAGTNFKIKATLSPNNVTNKKIKWTTNDDVIAYLPKTVSNSGENIVVKNHGLGNAKVKATATDGSKLSAVLYVYAY